AIGIVGILVITAEYSTGMIRASITAVPRRLPVLWAKALVYGLVTAALMIPAVLIAFVIGQSILSRHHIDTSLAAPGVARAVIGAGLYLTVVGLFGLCLGAIRRKPSGRVATFAALLFVLPPWLSVLPGSWHDTDSPYIS